MKYLIFAATLLMLSSCLTQKRLNKICQTCPIIQSRVDSVKITETVVKRDTVIKTEADSALLSLYLECQNGKVVVKEATVQQGQKTKQSYNLNNGRLTVPCKVDSGAVALSWLENHKEHWKTSIIETVKPVPAEFTKWQKIFMSIGKWVFWGAIVSLVGFIGFKLFKIYKVV